MRCRLLVFVAVSALGAACSDSAEVVDRATGAMSEASDRLQASAFCTAVNQLQAGNLPPEAVQALSDVIATNAPAEISGEVDAFLAQARRASDALATARASATGSELDAALESLSPEDRQFLTGLASAAATGALPGGPTGIVLEFARQNC